MEETIRSIVRILQNRGEISDLGAILSVIIVTNIAAGFGLAHRRYKQQIISSALKLPLLPLITTAVSLPSVLMVAFLLEMEQQWELLIISALSTQAFQGIFVLSFLPVILFFSMGSSYDFMKLLNVFIFSIGGLISVCRFMNILIDAAGPSGFFLFLFWAFLFSFVGCQTAWMLRPLIGSPEEKFAWWRGRSEMNFYSAILLSIRRITNSRGDDNSLPPTNKEG